MSDATNLHEGCHLELMGCEAQLLREIADPACKRKSVALTYAMTLQSSERTSVDFGKVNRAILARWSVSGLEWIKREAHRLAPDEHLEAR